MSTKIAITFFEKIFENILKMSQSFFHMIAELNRRGHFHGVNHIVNNRHHPFERFLWFMLVVCTIYCGIFVGRNQMERFSDNPTVISLERGNFLSIHIFPYI
jgi:hypothetical protein